MMRGGAGKLTVVLVGVLHTSAALAATYTVNAGESVQAAIDLAVAEDEIQVASGTYYEAVHLKSGIALVGGFPPGLFDPEARDWQAYQSIIDATGQVVLSIAI